MKYLSVLCAEALSMCSKKTGSLKVLREVLGSVQATSERVAV